MNLGPVKADGQAVILPESTPDGATSSPVSLEVGPVKVPDWLGGAVIFLHGPGGTLKPVGQYFWAEPFPDALRRIILSEADPALFPKGRVDVEVVSLEAREDGSGSYLLTVSFFTDDAPAPVSTRLAGILDAPESGPTDPVTTYLRIAREMTLRILRSVHEAGGGRPLPEA